MPKVFEFTPLSATSLLQYKTVNVQEAHTVNIQEENKLLVNHGKSFGIYKWFIGVGFIVVGAVCFFSRFKESIIDIAHQPVEKSTHRAYFPPLSTLDPTTLVPYTLRPKKSSPKTLFAGFRRRNMPVPTNSWCESFFLGDNPNLRDQNNRVYQIPYVLDTAGYIVGLRVHSTYIRADNDSVAVEIEPTAGMTIGAVEYLGESFVLPDLGEKSYITDLSVELEWRLSSKAYPTTNFVEPSMRAPIVRGSPYISMEYIWSTPRVIGGAVPRVVMVDRIKAIKCGFQDNVFNDPFLVSNDITVEFDNDHTWIVFVSKPMYFMCNYGRAPLKNDTYDPGFIIPGLDRFPSFELQATEAVVHGMIRIALLNNCTTGTNKRFCVGQHPNNPQVPARYAEYLRTHADVYPSTAAHVSMSFPSNILVYNWSPLLMSTINDYVENSDYAISGTELVTFGLPHHLDALMAGNTILDDVCLPTLHGRACLVKGQSWQVLETVPQVGFGAVLPIRREMRHAITNSLKKDLLYTLPATYLKGIGDTYFSGKMLFKLARILLVAEEMGYDAKSELFANALTRLREGTEIWLNGSALAKFVYDPAWGGLISCGCELDSNTSECAVKLPNCSSTRNPSDDFGNGFYNDHHFHYGYHIYAAAVLTRFNHTWGRQFHQHVLLLVRDIANPSIEDPYFPTWRHKDWFLGSSWSSGIVTDPEWNEPYPFGRNQESSAEAILAYEAISLFGEASASMFSKKTHPEDGKMFEKATLVAAVGHLLMATEVKSAQKYWQVRSPAARVSRVYPNQYKPKVVGILWSMAAQQKTFFGDEPWKSYGIQVVTISPASELRDDVEWLGEMLPPFNASCAQDPVCKADGWSILIYATEASLCRWRAAANAVLALPDSAFNSSGGNGQSRSNTLWWIATRPCA